MYHLPFLLLQAGTATSPSVQLPQEAAESLSLFSLLLKGGLVMIPIGLLSVLSVYFIIERVMYIRHAARIPADFMPTLKNHLLSNNVKEAKNYGESVDTALGRIVSSGLNYLGYKYSEIESAMEDTANIEISRMERHMSYLGIIAGIAPMLGFIGTISGIIRIFYDISVSDNISVGIIAGGLYEKMITSGSGLIVGVIAYVGYHLVNAQIDKFTLRMQENLQAFKSILHQKV